MTIGWVLLLWTVNITLLTSFILKVFHGKLNSVCSSLSQDKFIQFLLEATKKLTEKFVLQNNDTVGHIINCSSGILLLSMKKCDIQTNPNPKVSSIKFVPACHLQKIIHINDMPL